MTPSEIDELLEYMRTTRRLLSLLIQDDDMQISLTAWDEALDARNSLGYLIQALSGGRDDEEISN